MLSLPLKAAPVWNSASRPITPDLAAQSHTPSPQLPTRSLWIGNLDPSTTLSELQAVFAPYGPIESFRLIPEKVSLLDTRGCKAF